jgi:hypothetical protein
MSRGWGNSGLFGKSLASMLLIRRAQYLFNSLDDSRSSLYIRKPALPRAAVNSSPCKD